MRQSPRILLFCLGAYTKGTRRLNGTANNPWLNEEDHLVAAAVIFKVWCRATKAVGRSIARDVTNKWRWSNTIDMTGSPPLQQKELRNLFGPKILVPLLTLKTITAKIRKNNLTIRTYSFFRNYGIKLNKKLCSDEWYLGGVVSLCDGSPYAFHWRCSLFLPIWKWCDGVNWIGIPAPQTV